ncbi:MAG TPA: NADH-quinone oxidoreductase subunit L, partial [Gemmataceae bacterium]|nr:NADH-quinone oxidoreductase subunit L [Gemmataceae bacterium]
LLIPVLPLLAAIAIATLGYGVLKQHSHWPCILAAATSCVLSVMFLVNGEAPGHDYFDWFVIGDVKVKFGLQGDGLTLVMLTTVTFVGTLIAIYAAGYMHGDEGYPRFFAVVSLFLFSMTGLVMTNNLVVLYAFWEGVGVCSYLLIGFWFTRPAAAAAARKAFLVTRIGDVGLLLGILLIWALFQRQGPNNIMAPLHSFDYQDIFNNARHQSPELLFAVCLLLFCGAVGKSAQFPLHVWLPDAMEGPSPVSALIHAATMVTAGVYLVARCMPIFGLAPEAQLVVACIGGFTALLAALMAVTQTDLKRVLAYSTVSQLGYMFMALGSGLASEHLAGLAVTAAIFHLFTHAFFKALLFLGAGSVMHAMGGIIDMRRFGGLRKVLPITHWTFLCGAAALAGAPLLSGFWSKDEILSVVLDANTPDRRIYSVLFLVGLLVAGLTAFYTFRAYFMTFWGEQKVPHEAGHHAHESPPIMTVPLIILAVGAVAAGIVVGNPITHTFQSYLYDHWIMNNLAGLGPTEHEHAVNLWVMAGGSLMAIGGIGLAWWMYIKQPGSAAAFAQTEPRLYQLSRNRFYIDELYDIFIVKPLTGLSIFCRLFDQYVVDGLVDLLGQVPRMAGQLCRPLQNGLVQFYALLMVLGAGGFLLAVLLR